MNFLARSSRATGPKIRVPTGSPAALMTTAELLSKRMYEPSGRATSLAVRTITARTTSPFFTRELGRASLTEQMMTSPTPAYLRFEPPRTLMQQRLRAPELSATSSIDCIWIMAGYLLNADVLFQDLAHPPALVFRQRSGFDDQHLVADGTLVTLVVCLAGHTPLDIFFIGRVLDDVVHLDHHRLVHLVTDHHAHPGFPAALLC